MTRPNTRKRIWRKNGGKTSRPDRYFSLSANRFGHRQNSARASSSAFAVRLRRLACLYDFLANTANHFRNWRANFNIRLMASSSSIYSTVIGSLFCTVVSLRQNHCFPIVKCPACYRSRYWHISSPPTRDSRSWIHIISGWGPDRPASGNTLLLTFRG